MKSVRTLIAVMICLLPAVPGSSRVRYICPGPLKEGDRIAVVSPAYWLADSTVLQACSVLCEWGYEPVLCPNVGKMDGDPNSGTEHYAGTVSERLADLRYALVSDDIKAIICTRGGYGAIHLLDGIPKSMLRRHPKWLVGYSDITILHAMSIRSGVMSVHGDMCSAIAATRGECWPETMLREVLAGKPVSYDIPPHPLNVYGSTEGVMVGGNLATMVSLSGTEYDFLRGRDLILFIEDVGESMHSIDRMFNMLMLQKGFANVRAIVFGEFTGCRRDLPYESVEHMLSEYTSRLGIPVCYGFPSGHGEVNLPFVEGRQVRLEVDPQGARIW